VEPRIQYAKAKDGVSIAFWTLGEGMPFVYVPVLGFSHIQLEWQWPENRRWYERLAENTKLVRYDVRGSGLSERNVSDFSLDAHVLDLEAVVDRLGLERFVLFGYNNSGPVAVAYAARHPERVSHLILWCTFARGSDYFQSPKGAAIRALRPTDWEVYTETLARLGIGWSAGTEAQQLTAFLRECVTQETMIAVGEAIFEFDVTALLPQIRTPTLVLHRRQVAFPEVSLATELASRIPDVRLVMLEGTPLPPFLGDTDAVLAAIDEFLGEGEEAEPKTELPEGMAVLLFADIAESTALTEQLGDAAFRAKARELDASLRSVIQESGGTPVEGKVLGDGVLAVFTSARQAIDCALRCETAGEPLGLQLHLGIHAGDVIREGNNVYGGAVNIAARIAVASQPGEVLVSDTVRSLGRTSADVTFDDRGEHTLKGVGEPQRLFAVRGGG
jgi:class 3 adenylate cyclase